MRICIITTTLPPVTGGLETHVWELSRGLAEGGHNVTLIGSRNYRGENFPPYREYGDLRVYREWDRVLPVYYLRYRLFCLRAALRALRLHRERPFDIVHAHQVYPAGVAGAIFRTMTGVPLVISCHGTALFLNWEVPRFRPLMRWSLGRARRILGVGREIGERLISIGIPPGRVDLFPNWVDLERFSPERTGADLRRQLGWKPDDVVVGYLGRFHPVKGPQYFMELADRLLRVHPGLKFLLVGSGELDSSLRDRAERAGRENAFAFSGEVSHDLIPDYLGVMDILVVPSLAEGGGITGMEGMAMGKAVVANRVGGIVDLIDDGETGLLVHIGSARSLHYDPGLGEHYLEALAAKTASLVNDPPLRSRLGAAARRSMERNYSREAAVKKIVELYEYQVFCGGYSK